MKVILKPLILSLLAMFMLTGCLPCVQGLCGYRKDYFYPYYNNSACGPRILYRCDPICSHCLVNEPACMPCWECLSDTNNCPWVIMQPGPVFGKIKCASH